MRAGLPAPGRWGWHLGLGEELAEAPVALGPQVGEQGPLAGRTSHVDARHRQVQLLQPVHDPAPTPISSTTILSIGLSGRPAPVGLHHPAGQLHGVQAVVGFDVQYGGGAGQEEHALVGTEAGDIDC